jgi:hypothetical protein
MDTPKFITTRKEEVEGSQSVKQFLKFTWLIQGTLEILNLVI